MKYYRLTLRLSPTCEALYGGLRRSTLGAKFKSQLLGPNPVPGPERLLHLHRGI